MINFIVYVFIENIPVEPHSKAMACEKKINIILNITLIQNGKLFKLFYIIRWLRHGKV